MAKTADNKTVVRKEKNTVAKSTGKATANTEIMTPQQTALDKENAMVVATIGHPVLIEPIAVKMIPIADLHDHPENEDIYGKVILAPEWLETLREHGVRVSLRVTPRAEGGYTVTSGHRRKHGALAVGYTEVKCEVYDFKSDAEIMTDLLVSNQNREKTVLQLANEFLYWKRLLSDIKKDGADADAPAVEGKKSTDSKSIKSAIETLKKLGLEVEKNWRVKDAIQKLLGLTGYQQDLLTVLFDLQYREKYLQGMVKKRCDKAEVAYVRGLWEELTDDAGRGEFTLKAAFDKIKEHLEEVENVSGEGDDGKKDAGKNKGAAKVGSSLALIVKGYVGTVPVAMNYDDYSAQWGHTDDVPKMFNVMDDGSGGRVLHIGTQDGRVAVMPESYLHAFVDAYLPAPVVAAPAA